MKRGNLTREKLMDVIQDQPGINKMALCGATGLAWGTVFRHIKLLEEVGDVQVRREGRETQLFPAEVPHEQLRHLAALRDDSATDLLDVVYARGEVRIQELASDLKMSRKVIRRHLRSLCEAGLVEQSGHYHPRYVPADRDTDVS